MTTPEQLNQGYANALSGTSGKAASLAQDGREERDALARLEAYFADMTEESVLNMTAEVYAPGAYLNDNLAQIEGMASIRDYFLKSVRETDSLTVRFVDVARAGPDYYIRWVMTIRSPKLAGGQPIESPGITHFRLDQQGRVLVHKDFWDAATGFYEYIPVVGAQLRFVRRRLEASH